MAKYKIPVEVVASEDGGYRATCNALSDCHAQGRTIAEALDNFEDIARQLLEAREAEAMPIPTELRPDPKAKHVLKGELILEV
jgi:predicted RNase H-like HicB family nuclease